MDPRIVEMLHQQQTQRGRFPGVEPAEVEILEEEGKINFDQPINHDFRPKLSQKPVDYYQPYLSTPPGNCDVYLYVAINDEQIVKHKFLSDLEPEVYKQLRLYLVFWTLIGQVHDKFESFITKGVHKINMPDISYWYKVICKKQSVEFSKSDYIVVDQKPTAANLKEIRIYCGDEPIEFMKFK